MTRSDRLPRRTAAASAVCLLALFALLLAASVARDSSTWDEGNHTFAGYWQWARGDFGLNPEHPPLVKFLATAPLRDMNLRVEEPLELPFLAAAFLGGKALFIDNDADAILWRARMASGTLALLLALVVFLAAREMFGPWAGIIALLVVAFEPNVLAHGARVTTDTGVSLFLFATTYAFYRYAKVPSIRRLALVGVGAGLTIASKHTGLFVFPILALLAGTELLRRPAAENGETIARRAVRLAGAVAAIVLVAWATLWASYGFRFAARPEGLALDPPFAEYIERLAPAERTLVSTAAAWRVLPESYLYGLAAVRFLGEDYRSYALGTAYPQRVWFYFPLSVAIKSTIGFLALFALSIVAIGSRRLGPGRELWFLTIPPAVYFAIATLSGMNIGVRHILPIYAYFAALGGGAAWALARAHRRWAYAAALFLLIHVSSSIAAFPHYIPYANELWGGSSQTHRYLTDSSVDWAEQLKSVKAYCDEHDIRDGWFAYFGQGVLEPRAYDIPLRPLPTVTSLALMEEMQVPPAIEGRVFISAGVLSGFEFGPEALNPYAEFQTRQPVAVIDHSVFVYEGRFEIPLASALVQATRATTLLDGRDLEAALAEAESAVRLAPASVATQAALGDVLTALGRRDEARAAYQRALTLATTVAPEFQRDRIATLEEKLATP